MPSSTTGSALRRRSSSGRMAQHPFSGDFCQVRMCQRRFFHLGERSKKSSAGGAAGVFNGGAWNRLLCPNCTHDWKYGRFTSNVRVLLILCSVLYVFLNAILLILYAYTLIPSQFMYLVPTSILYSQAFLTILDSFVMRHISRILRIRLCTLLKVQW